MLGLILLALASYASAQSTSLTYFVQRSGNIVLQWPVENHPDGFVGMNILTSIRNDPDAIWRVNRPQAGAKRLIIARNQFVGDQGYLYVKVQAQSSRRVMPVDLFRIRTSGVNSPTPAEFISETSSASHWFQHASNRAAEYRQTEPDYIHQGSQGSTDAHQQPQDLVEFRPNYARHSKCLKRCTVRNGVSSGCTALEECVKECGDRDNCNTGWCLDRMLLVAAKEHQMNLRQ